MRRVTALSAAEQPRRRRRRAVDFHAVQLLGWLGSRVVSVLDSGAEGPGSNRSRDAVG